MLFHLGHYAAIKLLGAQTPKHSRWWLGAVAYWLTLICLL